MPIMEKLLFFVKVAYNNTQIFLLTRKNLCSICKSRQSTSSEEYANLGNVVKK